MSRLIKTLITKNPKNYNTNKINNTRQFVTTSLSSSSLLVKFHHPLLNPTTFNSSRFLSPLSQWISPSLSFNRVVGPLFLSSPLWQLSQSATPLFYLRKHAVVLKKVEALNLNFKLGMLKAKTLALEPKTKGLVQPKKKEEDELSVVSGGFVDSFVNLPNLISGARLVSAPLLGWMIVNGMYSYAFVGLAISGASDWLDGFVARKMKINSVVGSYLDPLADKVLIGSVTVGMLHQGLLHPGLVVLIVSRDVALVGGAMYQRASNLGWQWKSWSDFFNLNGAHPEKVEPLFISKVNTVFQLALGAAALLQPEFGTPETQTYIEYLSWLVGSTTVASTAAYGRQYMMKSSAKITERV